MGQGVCLLNTAVYCLYSILFNLSNHNRNCYHILLPKLSNYPFYLSLFLYHTDFSVPLSILTNRNTPFLANQREPSPQNLRASFSNCPFIFSFLSFPSFKHFRIKAFHIQIPSHFQIPTFSNFQIPLSLSSFLSFFSFPSFKH
jgi:hypothetical protein